MLLRRTACAARATNWAGVLSVELFREAHRQRDPQTVADEAKARTLAVWEAITTKNTSEG